MAYAIVIIIQLNLLLIGNFVLNSTFIVLYILYNKQ